MAQISKFMILLRTTLASMLAISATTATRLDAQSESARAYLQARQTGSVSALEGFIERYPSSPEASDAFRDIVLLSRGSRMANSGPRGLFSTTAITGAPLTRSVSVY